MQIPVAWKLLLNELITRRLRTRAIQVLLPVVSPRSSLVPLKRLDRIDRWVDDKYSDVESLNFIRNWAPKKKDISSKLDTDQGGGITQTFKSKAKQLNDRIQFSNSEAPDESQWVTHYSWVWLNISKSEWWVS